MSRKIIIMKNDTTFHGRQLTIQNTYRIEN
jgi:hypothetical protein